MSKYSSDSNSRDRTRSYSRYHKQRRRSSSSSSTESSSRHSSKHHSSRSDSRYHKKSKRRHRSSSSSEYSSSRRKRSSRSYRKDESYSKRSRCKRSSTTSDDSDHSNYSYKHSSKTSKVYNKNEKNKTIQGRSTSNSQINVIETKPDTTKVQDQSTNWLQKNVYDVMKRENSIEQINQEGFVFKVFKPLSEQKDSEYVESSNFDLPKLNEEVHDTPVEDSAFLISNPKRLLSAKYKLLTKQERQITWAKNLMAIYKQFVLEKHVIG